jgi:hypothetical protein
MTEDPRIGFIVGQGGWTKVAWPGGTGYVRFALNPDNKTWRIGELRLDPTDEALRGFSRVRIENAANAHSVVALGIAMGWKKKPPADLESMFRGKKPEPLSRLRLTRPQGKRLDANFYKQVALAYKGAVAEGHNPRQTLARDSGAAPDTVARWVAEARRLDYLPPAEPGKVSAGKGEPDDSKGALNDAS